MAPNGSSLTLSQRAYKWFKRPIAGPIAGAAVGALALVNFTPQRADAAPNTPPTTCVVATPGDEVCATPTTTVPTTTSSTSTSTTAPPSTTSSTTPPTTQPTTTTTAPVDICIELDAIYNTNLIEEGNATDAYWETVNDVMLLMQERQTAPFTQQDAINLLEYCGTCELSTTTTTTPTTAPPTTAPPTTAPPTTAPPTTAPPTTAPPTTAPPTTAPPTTAPPTTAPPTTAPPMTAPPTTVGEPTTSTSTTTSTPGITTLPVTGIENLAPLVATGVGLAGGGTGAVLLSKRTKKEVEADDLGGKDAVAAGGPPEKPLTAEEEAAFAGINAGLEEDAINLLGYCGVIDVPETTTVPVAVSAVHKQTPEQYLAGLELFRDRIAARLEKLPPVPVVPFSNPTSAATVPGRNGEATRSGLMFGRDFATSALPALSL